MSIVNEVIAHSSLTEATVLLLDSSDLCVKVEFAERGKLEYPEKNPQLHTEIDKSQPKCGAQDSIPGCRGARHN